MHRESHGLTRRWALAGRRKRWPWTIAAGKMKPAGATAGDQMNRDRLQKLLESLHRELADAKSVDQEARHQLGTLVSDIERVLKTPDAPQPRAAVSGRLEALIVRFEADHPAIAGAMRQLIDALAKAGI